jgi:hypothetical protein
VSDYPFPGPFWLLLLSVCLLGAGMDGRTNDVCRCRDIPECLESASEGRGAVKVSGACGTLW